MEVKMRNIDLQTAAELLRPQNEFPDEWQVVKNTFGTPSPTVATYIGRDFTQPDDQSRALLLWYCLEWMKRTPHDIARGVYIVLNGGQELNEGGWTSYVFGRAFFIEDELPETLFAAIKEVHDASKEI